MMKSLLDGYLANRMEGFMKLSDTYKGKLNYLIPFYRKQILEKTQSGIWQQEEFYKDDRTQSGICSSTIYSGLENQKLLAKDVVYEFAAKKLHKRCEENMELDKAIMQLADKVYALLNVNNEKKCMQILATMLPRFEMLEKEMLIYSEYIWFFQLLNAFLLSRNQLMTENDFLKLDAISPIYDGKLHELVLCYLSIYVDIKQREKTNYILEKYDHQHSEFFLNQCYLLRFLVWNHENAKALILGKQLILKMQQTNNEKNLANVYIDMAMLLKGFDEKELYHYLHEAILILQKNEFEEKRLLVLYLDMGALYLELGEYALSIKYFDLASHIASIVKLRCHVCICHCYHMLHENIPAKYLHWDRLEDEDGIDMRAYQYFSSYHDKTANENIKYIMKKVLPLLSKTTTTYITIFEKELISLCISLRGYKAFYEYHAHINGKIRIKSS